MPTTLNIDRYELRDALKDGASYLDTIRPMTDGARRRICHLVGLFRELVDEIDAEIESEIGPDSVSDSEVAKEHENVR